MSVPLFIASLEYAPGETIQDRQVQWVRLRVLVENGNTLWQEDGADEKNLVADYLEPNDIVVHGIVTEGDFKASKGAFGENKALVARIDVSKTNLVDFSEYKPGVNELTLRTFLTVCDGEDQSLFEGDDAWARITLSGKSLYYWYEQLKKISI
jgi:hypothetical protein